MSIELNGVKWTTWDDVRKEVFTPEEIAESDLRVALIREQTEAEQQAKAKDAFNSMRAKAAAKGYMTDAEIEAEIAAARRDGSRQL